MIWKVSSVYKISKKSKQNNYPAAHRNKPNPSFDELFSSMLNLPGNASGHKTQKVNNSDI